MVLPAVVVVNPACGGLTYPGVWDVVVPCEVGAFGPLNLGDVVAAVSALTVRSADIADHHLFEEGRLPRDGRVEFDLDCEH